MIRLMIGTAALLAVPAPAWADDLSTLLRGRWGMVTPEWTQHILPRSLAYTCEVYPGTPDTAMTFSGPLGAITVTTDHRIASPGPLSSPLTVGKIVKFDPAVHSERLSSARLIVEVEFERRQAGGMARKTTGLLGIVGPDRIVISQPAPAQPSQMFLSRCPG